MMFDEQAAEGLAKCIVLRCFRNTKLEDIHAGTTPHSETGDYSDVYVVTPAGKIAWNDVSKISDEEMKELMIEAVNKAYTFLMKMHDDAFLEKSFNFSVPSTHTWDTPTILNKF